MLNKLLAFMGRYEMVQPGDAVVCAVSGGADSMALLLGLHLLKDKLGIQLSAAHFNHGLRGEESNRDEAFVRQFCQGMGIPFFRGAGQVTAGEKGLEAAAREARYGFLESLPGKIATAHTADDNAETVLMRLVRGTGLKGLGAIAPVSGRRIRPMLSVTREEVLAFLEEYHVDFVEDSSNASDAYLRNRIRHHVMPLLKKENPQLAENLSSMALHLRQDEAALAQPAEDRVPVLRQMEPARRSRALNAFLENCGVREPESEHIALAQSLVFSQNPSARATFPGAVVICRCYDRLERLSQEASPQTQKLNVPGQTLGWGLRVLCGKAEECLGEENRFCVSVQGTAVIRSRQAGDTIRLSGGTKSLKKLFIDKKIPAARRMSVPVIADDAGVLWVQGFGPNRDRLSREEEAVMIEIEKQEAPL